MKKGNIGVFTLEDTATLYHIRFINENELIKIEDIKTGFTKWINKSDFWPLLDNMAY